MNVSKTLYYNISSLLPVRLLQKIAPVKTLFPYHHVVSDKHLPHIKHLYPYKNVKQFNADLDCLLKYYHPVQVQDIIDALKQGKQLPPNSFLLSFDDGFREIYDVVAPLLLAKGVPAIFFVNPAFLDNKKLFYRCKISLLIEEMLKRGEEELIAQIKNLNNLQEGILDKIGERMGISFDDYLLNEKPFLTIEQVKELGRQGFSIGAHSWDHPYYKLISEDEQIKQTIQSVSFVKDHFSPAYDLFSFPHSDATISQHFFDRIEKEHPGIDIFFGIQNQKEERNNKMLHRFNAERPILPMHKQLPGLLLFTLLQYLAGKNKVTRTNHTISSQHTDKQLPDG